VERRGALGGERGCYEWSRCSRGDRQVSDGTCYSATCLTFLVFFTSGGGWLQQVDLFLLFRAQADHHIWW
jgi:hypothetical protein